MTMKVNHALGSVQKYPEVESSRHLDGVEERTKELAISTLKNATNKGGEGTVDIGQIYSVLLGNKLSEEDQKTLIAKLNGPDPLSAFYRHSVLFAGSLSEANERQMIEELLSSLNDENIQSKRRYVEDILREKIGHIDDDLLNKLIQLLYQSQNFDLLLLIPIEKISDEKLREELSACLNQEVDIMQWIDEIIENDSKQLETIIDKKMIGYGQICAILLREDLSKDIQEILTLGLAAIERDFFQSLREIDDERFLEWMEKELSKDEERTKALITQYFDQIVIKDLAKSVTMMIKKKIVDVGRIYSVLGTEELSVCMQKRLVDGLNTLDETAAYNVLQTCKLSESVRQKVVNIFLASLDRGEDQRFLKWIDKGLSKDEKGTKAFIVRHFGKIAASDLVKSLKRIIEKKMVEASLIYSTLMNPNLSEEVLEMLMNELNATDKSAAFYTYNVLRTCELSESVRQKVIDAFLTSLNKEEDKRFAQWVRKGMYEDEERTKAFIALHFDEIVAKGLEKSVKMITGQRIITKDSTLTSSESSKKVCDHEKGTTTPDVDVEQIYSVLLGNKLSEEDQKTLIAKLNGPDPLSAFYRHSVLFAGSLSESNERQMIEELLSSLNDENIQSKRRYVEDILREKIGYIDDDLLSKLIQLLYQSQNFDLLLLVPIEKILKEGLKEEPLARAFLNQGAEGIMQWIDEIIENDPKQLETIIDKKMIGYRQICAILLREDLPGDVQKILIDAGSKLVEHSQKEDRNWIKDSTKSIILATGDPNVYKAFTEIYLSYISGGSSFIVEECRRISNSSLNQKETYLHLLGHLPELTLLLDVSMIYLDHHRRDAFDEAAREYLKNKQFSNINIQEMILDASRLDALFLDALLSNQTIRNQLEETEKELLSNYCHEHSISKRVYPHLANMKRERYLQL